MATTRPPAGTPTDTPAAPPAATPPEAPDGGSPKTRSCGTMPVHERLLRTMPSYLNGRIASENSAFQFARNLRSGGRTGVTVIPVVVHVVYNTAAQNISDAQVKSQLAVLNQDYRKTNADAGSTPAVFKPLAGDARIEFELATKDPNGASTTGITRTSTTRTSFTDDDQMKFGASGGHDAWPAAKYLNLWVVPRLTSAVGDLLGYAQFPGGAAATDGVVILHSAFGNTGTAAAPFNLGRTATHEVGHWLNLRHIWGDDGNGCSGDDFVADTPNCGNHNFGKPTFPHVTCGNGPNGDLFMNYMDYTDDDAMFMFTSGQIVRMQACLNTDRASIGYTKAGPSLFIADQPGTTLAASDHPTISIGDVGGPTLSVVDQHWPTVANFDHGPTLSVLDHFPTGILRDVPGPVLPGPGGDPGPFVGQPLQPGAAAVPFVLSTPHHTMAWRQSFPDIAAQQAQRLGAQIAQYEALLGQLAQADAAGSLSSVDAVRAEQATGEYTALVAEYRQLVGA